MKEAGGFAAISAPFVAGVATAGAFGNAPGWLSIPILAVCALSLSLSVLSKGRATAALVPALFFCGAFTFLSRSLSSGLPSLCPLHLDAEWLGNLIESIPFPHERTGALLKALLCGDRSDVSEATKAAFRDAGAAHILALSGLHLGVIYAVLSRCFRVFGNSRAAMAVRCGATILLCGLYTIMTGAGPSIVRAFLFLTINEILRLSPHRRMSRVDILSAALMIQLTIRPDSIFSVGFQLSYLAMGGIFILYPILEKWYPEGRPGRFDPMRKVWKMMALSISCQVFTGPLAWARFHSFPVHFLLTNLIAMPLTEALTGCAVASTVLCGMGLRPKRLIAVTDYLCELLQDCLAIIKEIQ